MKKTGFTLRADESAKAGLLRIADGLIEAALRCMRQPNSDPIEAVHLFRTTTKRLRALLQLIRPVIAVGAFEREHARLKGAADRFGAVRDRAIASETLKALGRSDAAQSLAGLADSADRVRADANHRRAMRAAVRELENTRREFHRLRIRGDGWDAIGPGLVKTYSQARRRMKTAFIDRTDQAFHRWRIRVKQLYHQLQWIEPVWRRRFTKLLKRLHRLEEDLGADHDLVVVRELLARVPVRDENRDEVERVKRSAEKRSRRLRLASEPLGAEALGEPPRRFCRRCEQRWRAWEKARKRTVTE
jgi:CHAD domain-containing protein